MCRRAEAVGRGTGANYMFSFGPRRSTAPSRMRDQLVAEQQPLRDCIDASLRYRYFTDSSLDDGLWGCVVLLAGFPVALLLVAQWIVPSRRCRRAPPVRASFFHIIRHSP